MTNNKYISTKDAVHLTGLSTQEIYDLIHEGKLPAHKAPKWVAYFTTRSEGTFLFDHGIDPQTVCITLFQNCHLSFVIVLGVKQIFPNFWKTLFPDVTFSIFTYYIDRKVLILQHDCRYANEKNVMKQDQIVIYQTEDGQTQIDVRLENETVWLTQAQMAELFEKDQSVIARHINNALKEGELDENSNMHFLHNTQYKYRPTKIYDLDTIICVGYRVHRGSEGTFLFDHGIDPQTVCITLFQNCHLSFVIVLGVKRKEELAYSDNSQGEYLYQQKPCSFA